MRCARYYDLRRRLNQHIAAIFGRDSFSYWQRWEPGDPPNRAMSWLPQPISRAGFAFVQRGWSPASSGRPRSSQLRVARSRRAARVRRGCHQPGGRGAQHAATWARCTACDSLDATLQHLSWGGNNVSFLPFPSEHQRRSAWLSIDSLTKNHSGGGQETAPRVPCRRVEPFFEQVWMIERLEYVHSPEGWALLRRAAGAGCQGFRAAGEG
jgi:hypothetical protein